MMRTFDFIIVGGGILGLATARELQRRFHGASVALLEKEAQLATHQTARNSGVIHAGVYYAPGSLKARFCREGNRATKAFCREHDLPYRETGKLLVATDPHEVERMHRLMERCRRNRIDVIALDRQQLRMLEPNVTGLAGARVPSTGITDFRQVALKLAEQVVGAGGVIETGCRVVQLRERSGVEVRTPREKLFCNYLVGCAGLHADRLVTMLGLRPGFRIIPFRGEYFALPQAKKEIVTHPIYPIPDPELPFLGIHLTPMIDGRLTVGPNAALALAREGYRRWTVNGRDLVEMLGYAGLYRLLARYPLPTLIELKNSLYRPGYLKQVQKYCPQIRLRDLRAHPAGVRAQAVKPDGATVDDFLFVESEYALIVGNAPSPAATSALPIAEHIVAKVAAVL